MKIEELGGGVIVVSPERFSDFRGYLAVPYDRETRERLGFTVCQINQGYSRKKNTLRGLHMQAEPYAQAKLVSCLYGAVYSVAVDVRKGSPTFGKYWSEILSFENGKLMYLPEGFAHGYLTLEDDTLVQWCVSRAFCAEAARVIRYDDPGIGIEWPLDGEAIVSQKDLDGGRVEELSF